MLNACTILHCTVICHFLNLNFDLKLQTPKRQPATVQEAELEIQIPKTALMLLDRRCVPCIPCMLWCTGQGGGEACCPIDWQDRCAYVHVGRAPTRRMDPALPISRPIAWQLANIGRVYLSMHEFVWHVHLRPVAVKLRRSAFLYYN